MGPTLRRIAREPLVHFLVLGAALFALDAMSGGTSDADDRTITLTAALRRDVREQWESVRAPTDDPSAAIDQWIETEVLYREGLARGFDSDDPVLRARIANKMRSVLEAQAIVAPPSRETLRAWYDAHADRFSDEARVGFTHVFVDGTDAAAEARARELLALLEGGASPARLGDTFSGGRRYRGRTIESLTAAFGDEFAQGLGSAPTGQWMVRRSRHGYHVLRLDERTSASSAAFAEVEEAARAEWIEEQREIAVGRAIEELRARYRVIEAP